jgi:hypothetical protein
MAIRRRTVTGTVERPHEAWEGGTVTFRLRKTSFTADAVIPESDVTALTDEDGNYSVSLWCDEDGLVKTEYRVWMPEKPLSSTHALRFDLSYGDGSPVALETILTAGVAATAASASAALLDAFNLAFAAFRALFSGVRTIEESETLSDTDFAIVADSETDIILALPAAEERELPYYVKNIGAGLVTVSPDGIETVNREVSLIIATGDAYIIVPATDGWETW